MQQNRHKATIYRGVTQSTHTLDEVLSVFSIDGFVPDDEFAADMELLVNGTMTPEEHRAYLKRKYQD